MEKIIIILLMSILIIISGCSKEKNCDAYNDTSCPDFCELCGDSILSSTIACHDKTYCEQVLHCNLQNTEKENCTGACSVCPPCPECSSLACQPTSLCDTMGFDKKWREGIGRE